MKSKVMLSIALKISFLFFALLGLIFSESPRSLYYYTLQSNIWMMIAQIVFLTDLIRVQANNRSFIKPWHRQVKFVLMTALLLTMFVYWFVLAPILPITVTFSVTGITLHLFAPSLALIDFLLFDNDVKMSNKQMVWTIIPPFWYLSFVAIFISLGITFPPESQLVPYFFLDYQTLGWFRISNNGIGVVYWCLIIMTLFIGLGFGLRKVVEIIHSKADKKSV